MNNKESNFKEYFDEYDVVLNKGLPLLGWDNDVRLNTEDKALLVDICTEAIDLYTKNVLNSSKIDDLALAAYNILKYQLVDINERADSVSTWYINSINLRPLISMIDEATMSFFRGYDLAALSILFIIVERYLRNIDPINNTNLTFKKLCNRVLSLPNTKKASKAYNILKIIYSHFDQSNPNQFYFNRHGLLHGLRNQTQYDQMNCVRLFLLLDTFCAAENVERKAFRTNLDMNAIRMTIYEKCRENSLELQLLNIKY